MTHSDLLSPQPPTVPGEDKRPVWGLIVADLEAGRYGPCLQQATVVKLDAMFRARDDFGAAKYGVRLPVDSNRDSRKDELQEAMDGLAYSRQTWERQRHVVIALGIAQHSEESMAAYQKALRFMDRAWARHLRCLQTVLELLEELSP